MNSKDIKDVYEVDSSISSQELNDSVKIDAYMNQINMKLQEKFKMTMVISRCQTVKESEHEEVTNENGGS